MSLPSEIWTRIFHLATDDILSLGPGIPTSFMESAWSRVDWKICIGGGDPASRWRLRSPEEALDILHRKNYSTKKVLSSVFLHSDMLTCLPLGNHLHMQAMATDRIWIPLSLSIPHPYY